MSLSIICIHIHKLGFQKSLWVGLNFGLVLSWMCDASVFRHFANFLIISVFTVDRAGLERTQVGESAPSRLEGGSTSAGADKV